MNYPASFLWRTTPVVLLGLLLIAVPSSVPMVTAAVEKIEVCHVTNVPNPGDGHIITIADQQGLPFPFPTIGLIAQPGDYAAYQNIGENQTIAVFGQATWHIGERWHLTGGLRWRTR